MKTKLISNLTDIRYEPSVEGLDENEFFPSMPKYSNDKWHIKKEKIVLGKKHELMWELYGFHVAYRKGIDSTASAIIWNCISVMKDNHVMLLLDTMKNVLPKNLNYDKENDNIILNASIKEMWKVFFDRLDGYVISLDKKERTFDYKVHEGLKKYNEMYRTILSNLRCALDIQHEQDPKSYIYFGQFMYVLRKE